MLALSQWERDQDGVATDASLFLDEVAMCLGAWKTLALVDDGKEYIGISRHAYKMDLQLDGDPVIAIATHPATVGATAKKLLDIRAATGNETLKI